MEIIFLNSKFLLLLIIIPLLIILHIIMLNKSRRKALLFSNFEVMKRISKKYTYSNTTPLLILRIIILTILIFIISDFRVIYEGDYSFADTAIGIDTSLSMLTDDIAPSRYEMAKKITGHIIDQISPNNKMGIFTFSSVVKIKTPMTNNKYLINEILNSDDNINNIGTDLSQAIYTGVNFFNEDNKPKNVILITDGQSNTGISLSEAISYAITKNVKIHTIGIGKKTGGNLINSDIVFKANNDLLIEISNRTGAVHFMVEDSNIPYAEINKMLEKSKNKIQIDLDKYFVIIIFILLVIEFSVLNILYKITP